MKNNYLFFSGVIIILLVSANCMSQTKKLQINSQLKSKFDQAVRTAAVEYLNRAGTVGLSIAIYNNGQNYMYSFGEAEPGSKKLIKANQMFNLGSVAKTFIGVMLAEAVIENKVRLTDDIRKYLPGAYPNLQYAGNPIRLIDIANHTSGLPKSSRIFPAKITDSIKTLSLPKQLDFFAKFNQDTLIQDMHDFKLDTIPGINYSYNGNAMTILILLLERIYHQPYEELVTHYLKRHLAMYNTRTKIPVEQLSRFIQGYKDSSRPVQWYDLKTNKLKVVNTNLFYPGGPSMNSTMSDMLKYVVANVHETDPAIRLSHQQTFRQSDGTGIALGWMIKTDNGRRLLYHSGRTGLGFTTLCVVCPEEKIGFMILVNDTLSQDEVAILGDKIKTACSSLSPSFPF